jgi:hypothetical protein
MQRVWDHLPQSEKDSFRKRANEINGKINTNVAGPSNCLPTEHEKKRLGMMQMAKEKSEEVEEEVATAHESGGKEISFLFAFVLLKSLTSRVRRKSILYNQH